MQQYNQQNRNRPLVNPLTQLRPIHLRPGATHAASVSSWPALLVPCHFKRQNLGLPLPCLRNPVLPPSVPPPRDWASPLTLQPARSAGQRSPPRLELGTRAQASSRLPGIGSIETYASPSHLSSGSARTASSTPKSRNCFGSSGSGRRSFLPCRVPEAARAISRGQGNGRRHDSRIG